MRRPGITKRPTVLVPGEYWGELMHLSKAALADLAWSLAARMDEQRAIEIVREETKVVLSYR